MSNGAVSNSYATGNLQGAPSSLTTNGAYGGTNAGGLIGAAGADVTGSYATGNLSGSLTYAGGLVGIAAAGTVTNSYATGNVTSTAATGANDGQDIGGLVGIANSPVTNNYATGAVSGRVGYTGGLIGSRYTGITLAGNYWNTTTAGQSVGVGRSGIDVNNTTWLVGAAADQSGVTGLSTAQMKAQASYTPAGTSAGQWDFTTNWVIYEGNTNPLLRSFLTPLTVTANNVTKTYDGQGATASLASYSVTPDSSLLGGTLGWSGAVNAGTYSPGGLYTTSQQGYLIGYGGTLTINRANATVTGNSSTGTYTGQSQSVSGFTVSGLVNSESAGVLSSPSASGASGTNAGSYTNTVTGNAIDGNYNVSYVNGLLNINKAPLTVTANSATKAYDDAAFTGGNGVTYSGFVNSETSAVLGGTLGFGGTSQGARNAGSYVITPNGLTSANYTVNFANGTLTINPAALSAIVASLTGSTSKVYDGTTAATLSPGNFVLSGFASGEGASVTKTSGTFDNANAGTGKTVTVSLNSSDYSATGGTLLSNYSLPASVSGSIGSVTAAPLTVTANGATKTFDGAVFTGGNGVTYSGFVNSETSAVLGGTLGFGGTSQGARNAGSYVITPNGLTSANYTVNFANGTLSIDRRPITVTGNSTTGTYTGQPQSADGFTVSGLVNNETASVLISLVTNGATGTNAGSYVNTVSGNAVDGNYIVRYVDGQLTINKANATVTANSASLNYTGLQQSVTGFTASGLVNGETTSVLAGVAAGGIGTNVGAYTATASAGGYNGNYNLSLVNGTLVIQPAALTVRADDKRRTFGDENPQLTATISGFVNGESFGSAGIQGQAGLSTTAGVLTPAGEVPILASLGTLKASNYEFSKFEEGKLTIESNFVPPSQTTTQTFNGTGSGSSNVAVNTNSGVVVSTTVSLSGPSVVTVNVPQNALSGFNVPVSTFGSLPPGTPVTVTLAGGASLPNWLSFDPVTMSLVSSAIPSDGLPVSITLKAGDQEFVLTLNAVN